MARPLRVEHSGGRYHVTARANERKALYRDDPDRAHFLELLSEVTERFGARVHAYVLMDNHYHLMVETPEGNLSRSMQWLNVSYSVWFNRRHGRSGHLFQGRFKAVVIEDDGGWQEVARYIHLNPVRVAGLKLGKADRLASRAAPIVPPGVETVAERLRQLREFKWSSYRAYAGYGGGVGWLWRQPLDRLCGGKDEEDRREAFRQYTEQPLRQGVFERPWDRLVAGLVLGSEDFARRLREGARGSSREMREFRKLAGRLPWEQIVRAVEGVKGESWSGFGERHGDWGRDAALWLGRKRGRYSLSELGELAGGLDYRAVGQAVSRFGRRVEASREVKRALGEIEARLMKGGTVESADGEISNRDRT